jgi:geranylgeranyl diphosphate synthase, type II
MIATDPIESALARAGERIADGTRVADAMRYAIAGGGKRLRPALVAACFEAVARRPADDRIADLGCAVELIHTYSLVHDDLPCMDDDDVRRGRATTHRVYGVDAATLAGAALIPLAFRIADEAALALGLSDESRRDIARTLAEAAGAVGMVGGQVMDVDTNPDDVDLEGLEAIHGTKTGALLRGACCLGAIAAGATGTERVAIDAYGRHLGMAFQITDDVLDETGSTEQLGKTAGKDRSAAKATFPTVLGLGGAVERASTEAVAAVEALNAAGLLTEALAGLSRFAVERNR